MRKAIPLIVGLIALGSAATGVAAADGRYPSGPVHLIVPFAAGGAVDIVGRLVGQQLSKALGQPVIVENITGAGGTIAATRVARASPDGYTILVGNLGTQIASIGSFKNLPYNPRTDFAPVMIVSYSPEVLLVNNSFPSTSLQDFIAQSKSMNRPVTIGHAGIGSISHLTYLLFSKGYKSTFVPVPYRGDIEADRDVMSGRVDAAFNWTILAAPYVKSGELRALAVLSPRRTAVMPDVPTSAEAGMPDLLVNAWTALFFPKQTPQPIIEQVNAALQKAFDDEAFVGRMNAIGLDVPPPDQRSPQALEQLVQSEFDKWMPLIREMQ